MKIEKPSTEGFAASLFSPDAPDGGSALASPIRALIFDLDGTLVDTLGGIANAINCALMRQGLAPLTISEVTDRVGEGGTALVEYALKKTGHEGDSESVARLQEGYFQAYLSAPIHGTRIFPGVIPMLERAQARNLDLAICTNKAGVLAEAVLDGLGLTRYFRFFVYGDSLPYRKPHPGPIKWIVEQMGVSLEACVMIGDTENDVRAARSSGVRSVFVSFGYGKLESLSNQPDWVVHHFDRLDPILRNFGRQQHAENNSEHQI